MNAAQPQRLDEATLERARSAVALSELIGRRVKLRRAGREWMGLCPFHQEKTPSFSVVSSKGFYHCFGCGAHGDSIRWLQDVEGLGFREAVESLLGGSIPSNRRPLAQRAALERPCDVISSATAGRWIFRTSGPARGEIVERWLDARGLDPYLDLAPAAPPHSNPAAPGAAFGGSWCPIDQLRFHPCCPVSAWRVEQAPEDAWLTAPAMVAPIADAEGAVWGVHVTYLSADGRSKAQLPRVRDGQNGGRERPTRKMFGKVGGNAVMLVPADALCSDAPLVVGEGVETSWAFAQQLGRPCRLAATLSLENLQGGAVKLRDGSLPLWNVQADPERAPFLLNDAGEVIIAVDADMKPLRNQKVQVTRGARPVVRDITGLQRAEICAALASQAWRRAGASKVTAMRPRMGMDFNDAIRSVA